MSPVVNINSISDCERAYKYHQRYGNYLTDDQLNAITEKWEYFVKIWDKEGPADEVDYSSEDLSYYYDPEDYSVDKKRGEDAAKKVTGFDGDYSDEIGRTVGNNLVAVGSTTLNVVEGGIAETCGVIGDAVGGVKNWFSKKGTEEVVKTTDKVADAASKGADAVSKGADAAPEGADAVSKGADAAPEGADASVYVAAALNIATALQYLIDKPNKDAKEACDALQTEMAGAQSALNHDQNKMDEIKEEINVKKEEAEDANEKANDDIKDKKTESDMYKTSYKALKLKIANGEPLTDSEKELYKSCVALMQANGEKIQEISQNATDFVAESHDEIANHQGALDRIAGEMNEVNGLTDYAASFDKLTQGSCYTVMATQGLNAASSVFTAARLIAGAALKPWDWAVLAGVVGAATSSTYAASEQYQWAGEVGTEVEMREATQDLSGITEDVLGNTADVHDNTLDYLTKELVLEVPEEIPMDNEPQIPEVLMPNNLAINQKENPENNKKKNETV